MTTDEDHGAEAPGRASTTAQGGSLTSAVASHTPEADFLDDGEVDPNGPVKPPAYDHLLDRWNVPEPDRTDEDNLRAFLFEVTKMMALNLRLGGLSL